MEILKTSTAAAQQLVAAGKPTLTNHGADSRRDQRAKVASQRPEVKPES